MMIRHLDMLCALKGETVAVKEFRKYLMRYTKGMRGAASFRRMANDITKQDEMNSVIAAVWQ
jgi:tRNA-dihydrouridine synthase